jgi:hypothetical protein
MTTVRHHATHSTAAAIAKRKAAAKKAAAHKAAVAHAAAVKAQALKQQQLGMSPSGLLPGLTSPYDGTSPLSPALGSALGFGGTANPGSAHVPQVNATNQSALAPNGDINQSVTNNNNYENRYYNIVSLPQTSGFGGIFGGLSNLGNGLLGNQSYVDPQTGVMYTRQEPGVIGWFKRLLRGY